MKRIVIPLLVAAFLWFFMFSPWTGGIFNFWTAMSFSRRWRGLGSSALGNLLGGRQGFCLAFLFCPSAGGAYLRNEDG